MSKVYAGIGSRRTPQDVLELIYHLACRLSDDGWWLRSGNAPGADLAFQAGAGAHAEVFVPWSTFGPAFTPGSSGFLPTPEAFALAERFHPAWHRCGQAARKLHARNSHQVLGADLASPARFVVCWTPDGSLDGSRQGAGGTGQALRIAAAHDVPVFNLARPEHRARVERFAAGQAVVA